MGSRSLSKSSSHAKLLKFHHLSKVEKRTKETAISFLFCWQKEKEDKRTYDYLIVMNNHRVHAPVWCVGLTLTHTMHSRPRLLATPKSQSSRRGFLSIDSSSSCISVELKSKYRRKFISSSVPQLDCTGTGGCLTPVL